MASLFIDVKVDAEVASNAVLVAKLVEVCPVGIFATKADGALEIVEENLDECTLCDLCTQAVPDGGVKVIKLYE